ncbi:MAG: Ig-like domain-containing protein, partial [Acidimicrobiales bacterium]
MCTLVRRSWMYPSSLLRSVVVLALLASMTTMIGVPPVSAAAGDTCLNPVAAPGTVTLVATDFSVRGTATATGTVAASDGRTADWTFSIRTYTDAGGVVAPIRSITKTGNGFSVVMEPSYSGYNMDVAMAFSNVIPADAPLQLMLFGLEQTNSDGYSRFNVYTLNWTGTSSNATIIDPANQLTYNGAPANGAQMASGTTFTQNAKYINSTLRWSVAAPIGADSFSFTAGGGAAWEGFSFGLGDVVCPPEATDDTTTIRGGQTAVIDARANDGDYDGEIAGATSALINPATGTPTTGPVTVTGKGTWTIDPATGVITFVPVAGYTGTATIDYQLTDTQGLTDTATATVTVLPPLQPPTAVDDDATTALDTPITLDPLANDTDPDSTIDSTTVRLIDPATDQPTSGPVTVDGVGAWSVDPATGAVTFTPVSGYLGNAAIDYVVSDPDGNVSAPASITVAVLDPPITAGDSAVTEAGQPVNVNVLANDSGRSGTIDPTTVRLIDPATDQPTSGPVTVDGVGTWSIDPTTHEVVFTPASGYHGIATIGYVVADSNGTESASATVEVEVQAPPIATDDAGYTVSGIPVTIDVPANDTDPDSAVARTTVQLIDPVTDQPTRGPVTISGVGTWSVDTVTGKVTFTPELTFAGTANLDYVIADTEGHLSSPATITTGVQPPPYAVPDTARTVDTNPVTVDPTLNDIALAPIDPTTVRLIDPATDQPTSGPLTVDGVGTWLIDPTTGEVTFTPGDGYAGTATVDYVVTDTDGNVTNPAPIFVLVQVTPTALDDSATTVTGQDVTLDVLANDTDTDGTIDPATLRLIDPATNQPTTGPVTIAGVGTFSVDPITREVTFAPRPGYHGTASIRYVVADNDGLVSDPARAVIDVQAPPVAYDDATAGLVGETLETDLSGNDTDPDGIIDRSLVQLIDPATNQPATGPIVVDNVGTYRFDPATGLTTFVPDPGFAGSYSIDYIISDGQGLVSAPAVYTTIIWAPPVAADDQATTLTGRPVLIPATANDVDPDGMVAPYTIRLIDPATNQGTWADLVTVDGVGTFEVDRTSGDVLFTPADGFSGPAGIDYTVGDDFGFVSNVAHLTVDVQAPPATVADSAVTLDGQPVRVDVLGNDRDPDGWVQPETVQLIDPATGEPASGPVEVDGVGRFTVDPVTGAISFTPAPGYHGPVTVDYVVADDDGNLSEPTTLSIEVQAPPVAAADSGVDMAGHTVGIDVLGNDTDLDGTVGPDSVRLIDLATDLVTSEPVTIAGVGTFSVDPVTGIISFS